MMSDRVDAKVGDRKIRKDDDDEDDVKDVGTVKSQKSSQPQLQVVTSNLPLYYKMDHPKRGLALILNHEHFDENTGQERREGTGKDVVRITAIFEKLKFQVEIKNDLTVDGIDEVLKDVKSRDFTDCDCLFVFVLTHGNLLREVKKDTRSGNSSPESCEETVNSSLESCEETVLWAKDSYYNPNLIFKTFTPNECPTLVEKPKVIIIQACRGKKVDDGYRISKENPNYTTVDGCGVISKLLKRQDPIVCRLPLYVDFLCAWSTLHRYYSFRNPKRGTCFIEFLCATLEEYYDKLSFCDILTMVNGLISDEFESSNSKYPEIHGKKQTSTYTSQLTKLLSFSSKIENQFVSIKLK